MPGVYVDIILANRQSYHYVCQRIHYAREYINWSPSDLLPGYHIPIEDMTETYFAERGDGQCHAKT